MVAARDLTGKIFSRWEVLRESRDKKGRRAWLCRCECGNLSVVITASLTTGNSRSCGCLQKDKASSRGRHRRTSSREYYIWAGIKARCNNPSEVGYENYGGRGITYDPKWETFEGFWEDMADGYVDNLSIDRIDNNSNYCKDNCRWATALEQNRNRRKPENNTSGHTGIREAVNSNGNRYWRGDYGCNGKNVQKYFSIDKMGERGAFEAAKKWREDALKAEGYSEGHGQ